MLRTHSCAELKEKHIGEKVTLCGWVHSRRDHGNLVFIDLRDKEGITQIVFWGKELIKKISAINCEYVILVKGEVNRQPKGTENPKVPTGLVEVAVVHARFVNLLRPGLERRRNGDKQRLHQKKTPQSK